MKYNITDKGNGSYDVSESSSSSDGCFQWSFGAVCLIIFGIWKFLTGDTEMWRGALILGIGYFVVVFFLPYALIKVLKRFFWILGEIWTSFLNLFRRN